MNIYNGNSTVVECNRNSIESMWMNKECRNYCFLYWYYWIICRRKQISLVCRVGLKQTNHALTQYPPAGILV